MNNPQVMSQIIGTKTFDDFLWFSFRKSADPSYCKAQNFLSFCTKYPSYFENEKERLRHFNEAISAAESFIAGNPGHDHAIIVTQIKYALEDLRDSQEVFPNITFNKFNPPGWMVPETNIKLRHP